MTAPFIMYDPTNLAEVIRSSARSRKTRSSAMGTMSVMATSRTSPKGTSAAARAEVMTPTDGSAPSTCSA